jgi:phosphatidylinositol alpha-mannosyltransferase
MKIALVSEYYYPDVGGMPECVHHLARELAQRGHEPVVLTANFGNDHYDMDRPARIIRLGRSAMFWSNGSVSRASVGWRLGSKVRDVLEHEKFDLIHVHNPLFPTLPYLCIKHAPNRTRLLGTLHTYFDSNIMKMVKSVIGGYLTALDGVTAVSDNAGRSVNRYYPDVRYRVIPNGVDLAWCASGRRLPQYDDDRVNFLFLGRLEPRNEVPRLLSAFMTARKKGPPMRLILVGDGPDRPDLERMVPPELLGDEVLFAGTVLGGRPDYFATADVYCFTTRIGALPISLLEGMAAGLPVIAPGIEPVAQLLKDRVQGRVLGLDDTDGFAGAMVELAGDEVARQRMGHAARAAVEPLAWPSVVDQYLRAYDDAL